MTSPPAAPATKPRTGGLTRAILWMGMALFCFSAIAIAGREAGRVLTTSELIFWRSLLGACVLGCIYKSQGAGLAELRPQVWPLHVGRALVHYAAQYAWLAAVTLIPLAEVFALEFTSPLWVAVLAPLFLGERLSGWRLGSAALGFFGALLVAMPGLLGGHVTMSVSAGTLLAAASAVGFAASMIATKRLTRTDPVLRILLVMQVLQGLIAAALIAWTWLATAHLPASLSGAIPTAIWGWVVMLGIAGLGAHYCQMRAFALADAIIVAPMDFLRLPLIAVVGAMFYGETLQMSVAIGAAVVVAANALNMWGERRGANQQTAKV